MFSRGKAAFIVALASGMAWATSIGIQDEKFAKSASQGGAAEVKLGQLAAGKAENPKVKEFGQKMAADHSKAGDELSGIVQRKNVTASFDLNAKDYALLTKLATLSGSAFDQTYMSAMVKDHEDDLAEFQREADSGQDPDLKAFASKTMPTLQEHLKMAKDAASAVGVQ